MTESAESAEQVTSEIQQRLIALLPMEGIELKHEMDSLKRVLLENPAACTLLLDEDIGRAVQALRKITGTAIAEASTPKKRATKPKALTPTEIAAALDNEDW
jgi:hypothetical protein